MQIHTVAGLVVYAQSGVSVDFVRPSQMERASHNPMAARAIDFCPEAASHLSRPTPITSVHRTKGPRHLRTSCVKSPANHVDLSQIILGSEVAVVSCRPTGLSSEEINRDPIMPRPRSAENEANRSFTEEWRLRRRASGRPEASDVDRALAASIAAFFSEAVNGGVQTAPVTLRDVVKGAQRILVRRGFDKALATGELRHRLSRRADLVELVDLTGAHDITSKNESIPPITPHL